MSRLPKTGTKTGDQDTGPERRTGRTGGTSIVVINGTAHSQQRGNVQAHGDTAVNGLHLIGDPNSTPRTVMPLSRDITLTDLSSTRTLGSPSDTYTTTAPIHEDVCANHGPFGNAAAEALTCHMGAWTNGSQLNLADLSLSRSASEDALAEMTRQTKGVKARNAKAKGVRG